LHGLAFKLDCSKHGVVFLLLNGSLQCPSQPKHLGCRDGTAYPLAGRSLRCVTGANRDEAAADSNGAGKSALVMAPLWALTGRSDARSEVRAYPKPSQFD
jgi:hypothetical protein